MRIVIATSEAVPFAKTGGLADVSSALAKALDRAGHEVSLILPYFPQALKQSREPAPALEPTGHVLEVPIGSKTVGGRILKSRLPGSDVRVFLIDRPEYFDRSQLYQSEGRDYK